MRKRNESFLNRKVILVILVSVALVYLVGIFFWGIFMNPSEYAVHYENKLLGPSGLHFFGTDGPVPWNHAADRGYSL